MFNLDKTNQQEEPEKQSYIKEFIGSNRTSIHYPHCNISAQEIAKNFAE